MSEASVVGFAKPQVRAQVALRKIAASARDLAILARALIREFPEYDAYWHIASIRFGTSSRIRRIELGAKASGAAHNGSLPARSCQIRIESLSSATG